MKHSRHGDYGTEILREVKIMIQSTTSWAFPFKIMSKPHWFVQVINKNRSYSILIHFLVTGRKHGCIKQADKRTIVVEDLVKRGLDPKVIL